MAGLGDIWHSHPWSIPFDMEVQPPELSSRSPDGASDTWVQIRPKSLTDLEGKDLFSSGDQTPHWQQPRPPFTKLLQSLGFASTLAHCFSYLKSTFPLPPCNILNGRDVGVGSEPEAVQVMALIESLCPPAQGRHTPVLLSPGLRPHFPQPATLTLRDRAPLPAPHPP